MRLFKLATSIHHYVFYNVQAFPWGLRRHSQDFSNFFFHFFSVVQSEKKDQYHPKIVKVKIDFCGIFLNLTVAKSNRKEFGVFFDLGLWLHNHVCETLFISFSSFFICLSFQCLDDYKECKKGFFCGPLDLICGCKSKYSDCVSQLWWDMYQKNYSGLSLFTTLSLYLCTPMSTIFPLWPGILLSPYGNLSLVREKYFFFEVRENLCRKFRDFSTSRKFVHLK